MGTCKSEAELPSRTDTDEGNPRLGRCYQLCGEYVSDNLHAVLIHGTIQRGDRPPLPHAWVEYVDAEKAGYLQDRYDMTRERAESHAMIAYDPVWDERQPVELHRCLSHAEEFERYTFDEVLQKMQETEHWGPWDARSDAAHEVFVEWQAGQRATQQRSKKSHDN